jgi:RIO kinase 1
MKVPLGLQPLVDNGVVDSVVRQLQSGKEATVYVVACGEELLCAKVYKSIDQRSFQRVAEYREGRKARGSRNARATGKRGKQGKHGARYKRKNGRTPRWRPRIAWSTLASECPCLGDSMTGCC